MDRPRIDLVLPHLRCPVCGERLTRAERAVGCRAGHRYDLARQGYLTLLGGRAPAGPGDTADMVAAREAFLERGHYRPIATALAEAVSQVQALHPTGEVAPQTDSPGEGKPRADSPGEGKPRTDLTGEVPRADPPGEGAPRADSTGAAPPPDRRPAPDSPPVVLDLAGGTGHYLAAVLDAHPTAVGLNMELSPYAARRSARAHPRLAAVRADVWQPLPVATGSCAVVLSVFGPRNPAEIVRVLGPGGWLVVVAPAPDHLGEIVEPLGMLEVAPDKAERLSRQLAGFVVAQEERLRFRADLTPQDVRHVVLMGPTAHHVNRAELNRRLAAFPEGTSATIAVTVTTYGVA